MSVALDWSTPRTSTTRGPRERRGKERHLRLVPPPAPPRRARRTWRLTRRGRLVRTLAVFTAVALAALIRFVPFAHAPWQSADHAVTVERGQSLTQVAAEHLPGVPLPEAARAIQVFNDLPNEAVYAGQLLVIPAR